MHHSLLLTLGTLVSVAACSSSPDPILYTLAAPDVSEVFSEERKIIGLSELSLPAYARNNQITTALSEYRLSEDDDHRWASPPSEALTAALSKTLERSTGDIVIQSPYPSGVQPDIRVSITFDRILRGQGGRAEMSGQYFMQNGRQAREINRFSIVISSSDSSYEAYMAALSEGMNELSLEIAQAIKKEAQF